MTKLIIALALVGGGCHHGPAWEAERLADEVCKCDNSPCGDHVLKVMLEQSSDRKWSEVPRGDFDDIKAAIERAEACVSKLHRTRRLRTRRRRTSADRTARTRAPSRRG